jgi:hypothetical protein
MLMEGLDMSITARAHDAGGCALRASMSAGGGLTFINLVVNLPGVLLIYVASHRHARTEHLLASS